MSPHVQLNLTKMAWFRMKVYHPCQSDGAIAGYTGAFKTYMSQDCGDVPANMKVVIDLMDRACCFKKSYKLYLDNCYRLLTLYHYLQLKKINTVGTRFS